MANTGYVSQYDGTLVKIGGTYRRVDKGAAVPDGADAEHVAVLVERGMLVEGEPAAGFIDPAPSILAQPAPAAGEADVPDGPGPIPAKSADKPTWVAYAVSQGMSEDDANAATKDQLIEQYGIPKPDQTTS